MICLLFILVRMLKTIKSTKSVCPECFRKESKIVRIDAELVEKDGQIYLQKECDKHGEFEEIYWVDLGIYEDAQKYFSTGIGVTNPQIKSFDCPHDCGLCTGHKS